MLSDPSIKMYLFGVLGSAIAELMGLWRAISANNRKIPNGYYTRAYVIVRILIAVVAAGTFAYLLAEIAWTALYVGITAPLIYDRVAAGIQDNGQATHHIKAPNGAVPRPKD
jgi:hypothetical protein